VHGDRAREVGERTDEENQAHQGLLIKVAIRAHHHGPALGDVLARVHDGAVKVAAVALDLPTVLQGERLPVDFRQRGAGQTLAVDGVARDAALLAKSRPADVDQLFLAFR